MVSIGDFLNNILSLLDKYFPRKNKDATLHNNGVVTTDNNGRITSQQSLSASGGLISGLSSVATSGDYRNLSNTPTKLSDFTVDDNFTLSYNKISNAPTNISSFTINDNYISWSKINSTTIPNANATTKGIVKLGTTSDTASKGDHNHDGTYLKLSGGTLTGQVSSNSNITTTGNITSAKVITNTNSSNILLANGNTKPQSDFLQKGSTTNLVLSNGDTKLQSDFAISGHTHNYMPNIPISSSLSNVEGEIPSTKLVYNALNTVSTHSLTSFVSKTANGSTYSFPTDSTITLEKIGKLVICNVHLNPNNLPKSSTESNGTSNLPICYSASSSDYSGVPVGFRPNKYIVTTWVNTTSKGSISFNTDGSIVCFNAEAKTSNNILANVVWITND